MQVDMHFYGTYAVARIAGFSPDEARTIATSAQFVDEAVAAEPVLMNGQRYLLPIVSAHKMYEIIDNSNAMDQWRVWVPFHFLPGGLGNRVSERAVCAWGDTDNAAAESIIQLALSEKGQRHDLHLLGIVTHVLQDTYAHYGFSGFATRGNTIKQASLESEINDIGDLWNNFINKAAGTFAEGSLLGHASVATCPDTPYLEWKFEYEDKPNLPVGYSLENRNNKESFYRACTRLLALYEAFVAGKNAIDTPDGHGAFDERAQNSLQMILAHEEEDKEDRCEMWRERIEAGGLFDVDARDKDLQYSDAGWNYNIMIDNLTAGETDAYHFHQAAELYLDHIQEGVLPSLRIL